MSKTLLVATHNRGKVKEIARMLADEDVAFLTLADLDIAHDVAETAPDFMGNARLKAVAYARMSGYLTLADDSGLEVDALGGRPGVHTKRYGGDELDDEGRYRYLLANLVGVPAAERGARFRCVMVLARADGVELGWTEGVCEGRIGLEPAGSNGFGYDPVFYLPELGRTMAQLTGPEKNERSHRGRALAAMVPLLKEQLQSRSSFRRAKLTDLQQVATWVETAAACRLWAGSRVSFPLDTGNLAAELNWAASDSLVMVDADDQLLAFGQLFDTPGGGVHLARIIVAPQRRGVGLGRQFVNYLLRSSLKRKPTNISLNVAADNVQAKQLYRSLGFVPTERPAGQAATTALYMTYAPLPSDEKVQRS